MKLFAAFAAMFATASAAHADEEYGPYFYRPNKDSSSFMTFSMTITVRDEAVDIRDCFSVGDQEKCKDHQGIKYERRGDIVEFTSGGEFHRLHTTKRTLRISDPGGVLFKGLKENNEPQKIAPLR